MSKKRRVASDRSWPPELKGPFPMQEIIDQATEANPIPDTEDEDSYFNMQEQQAFYIDCDVRRLALAEIKKRVALLAHFFGLKWPENEDDWLALLFEACVRCKAPGFRIPKKAGAHKKWDRFKNRQLFADVMSIAMKRRDKSEHAAVKQIARDPRPFLKRYLKYIGRPETLHRQFLRAKEEFERLERIDYSSGSFLPRPINRDDMIRQFIDSYSAEAEWRRRK
jgi:hypothetical protein